MAGQSFSKTEPGYKNLWAKMTLQADDLRRIESVSAKIIAEKKKWYLDVEKQTGVPWFWIAAVHHREYSGRFSGILHNGEQIIGTGKKTTLVPKGRGPFGTWRESAIDALQFKKLDQIPDWTIARCLYEFERYNGWGYYGRINSPYVWAATSLQQRGKYVADGKYDAGAWDEQLGCAAILKGLMALDPGIQKWLDGPDTTSQAQKIADLEQKIKQLDPRIKEVVLIY